MGRLCILSMALMCWVGAPAVQADPVRIDYMLNCQGCHLPGGEGYPERGVPRLRGQMGKFLGVEGGRAYLVQVPGVALSDLPGDRLAEVLNWTLVEFSQAELPTNFVPYTADEVAELRKTPLIEVTPVREALIERIRAAEEGQHDTSSGSPSEGRQDDDP